MTKQSQSSDTDLNIYINASIQGIGMSSGHWFKGEASAIDLNISPILSHRVTNAINNEFSSLFMLSCSIKICPTRSLLGVEA